MDRLAGNPNLVIVQHQQERSPFAVELWSSASLHFLVPYKLRALPDLCGVWIKHGTHRVYTFIPQQASEGEREGEREVRALRQDQCAFLPMHF